MTGICNGAGCTAAGARRRDLQTDAKGGFAASSSSLHSFATTADADEHAGGYSTQLSASSAGDTLATLSSEASMRFSTARTSTNMLDDDKDGRPYAHPAVAVLELTSDTASSSALPDSFGFSVSRGGTFVAVYTASSMWLIRTTQLPRLWARTLQVTRKPVAIDVQDDGSLLAVLSRPSQVDLYDIQGDGSRAIKKRRTILLVHEASSMALSPDGLILITGNKFGIEVISIALNAPESCRRTLSGPVGDSLEFSDDGRTLLITGYARKSGGSSMFVLPGLYDGPLNEEGVPIPTAPEAAWTGLVLFPETSRTARQATLLPDADTGHIDELFAFNSDEDTWGIYDIPSQRFTRRKMFLPDQQRWSRAELLDEAMPAISPNADLAAVALRIRGTTSIWIYQVLGWDFKPKSQGSERSPVQPCFCIPVLDERPGINLDITVLRWIKIDNDVQRLVAVGNISTLSTESDRPSVPEGSKGVVIVLDFDGTKPIEWPTPAFISQEYDLDPLLPGEKLPEGSIDFEREVELVRTRTLAQRRAQDHAGNVRRNSRIGSPPVRAQTSASRSRPTSIRPIVPIITRDDSDELTMEEAQAAFEAPYDNTQPRSQNSLARAATVAAVSPANRRHLRALPSQPLEYRRADGLREPPHESDADNWQSPPPAYTSTAEASQSVSLSHPAVPPVPVRGNIAFGSSIPPVPPLPAAMNSFQLAPTNPYQHRPSLQSVSSTDLSLPVAQSRRPSLLHPSTYPAPQLAVPRRSRSSAAPSPPTQMTHVPSQEQGAYQATAAYFATAGRSMSRTRRAAGNVVDLRPPPVIDPSSSRRGSAPDMTIHRRPVPQAASGYSTVPAQGTRAQSRRLMLPRLSTTPASVLTSGPLTAPPRTDTGQRRAQSRPGTRTGAREKPRKKKINCVVM